MAFTQIAHTAVGTVGALNAVTPAANITGATLLWAVVICATSDAVTVTDGVNTWVALPAIGDTQNHSLPFYCLAPTTSTTYQLSTSGVGVNGLCLAFQAWSGGGVFQTQHTAHDSGLTAVPGPVTPTQNGALVLTSNGVGLAVGSPTYTVDAGFTLDDQVVRGVTAQGLSAASFVQTTAATISPTWTGTAGAELYSTIVVFTLTPSGGGGGPYTLVAARADALGAGGGTSGTLDTRGADLLVLAPGYFTAAHTVVAADILDSLGNTYQALTAVTTDNNEAATRLFYCQAPTVGAAHTVTIAQGSTFMSLAFAAFHGSVTSPFDVQNTHGSTGPVTASAPGPVTPSQPNELVVTSVSANVGDTFAIDSGFTIAAQSPGASGDAYSVGLAYLTQGAATTVGPVWTGMNYRSSAAIATFKAGAIASTGNPWWLSRQLGQG